MKIKKCNVLNVEKLVKESSIQIVDSIQEDDKKMVRATTGLLTDHPKAIPPFECFIKPTGTIIEDLKDKDVVIYKYTTDTYIIVSK